MDETGLLFRLEPNKTLASKTGKGSQKTGYLLDCVPMQMGLTNYHLL